MQRNKSTTAVISRRIIAPGPYANDEDFPTDGEGNVLPGTYVVEFYTIHEGQRHFRTKTYNFEYPPGIRKEIVIEGQFPDINHYSHLSDTPTMWNDSDISL